MKRLLTVICLTLAIASQAQTTKKQDTVSYQRPAKNPEDTTVKILDAKGKLVAYQKGMAPLSVVDSFGAITTLYNTLQQSQQLVEGYEKVSVALYGCLGCITATGEPLPCYYEKIAELYKLLKRQQ